MSLYSDIIEVRRQDASTAGDIQLLELCVLVLSDGVEGNPFAEDDARSEAILELGRRYPDSHTADAAELVRMRHIDDVLGTPV